MSAWPHSAEGCCLMGPFPSMRIPIEVSGKEKWSEMRGSWGRWRRWKMSRYVPKRTSDSSRFPLSNPAPRPLLPILSLDYYQQTAETGHGVCFHLHLIGPNENCNYWAITHPHMLQGCCPWHICYPHLENSPIKAPDSPALCVEICNSILCVRDKNSPWGYQF